MGKEVNDDDDDEDEDEEDGEWHRQQCFDYEINY